MFHGFCACVLKFKGHFVVVRFNAHAWINNNLPAQLFSGGYSQRKYQSFLTVSAVKMSFCGWGGEHYKDHFDAGMP